jgi:hypothetical protein
MESMSNVPYYVPKARFGSKFGNQELVDGIVQDGLTDVYNKFLMGNAAELCAKKYDLTREMQVIFHWCGCVGARQTHCVAETKYMTLGRLCYPEL